MIDTTPSVDWPTPTHTQSGTTQSILEDARRQFSAGRTIHKRRGTERALSIQKMHRIHERNTEKKQTDIYEQTNYYLLRLTFLFPTNTHILSESYEPSVFFH